MKRLVLFYVLFVSHAALAGPFAKWQGQVAETTAGARASLTPDGPWLPIAAKAGVRLNILDDRGARPQFLDSAQGVNLLLYAEPSALKTFSLKGAALYPAMPAAAKPLGDRSPGMKLEAGTRIDDATAVADGLTKVRLRWIWTGGSLQVDGFVPTANLGKIYTETETDATGNGFVPDVTLPDHFQLLDAPRGKPFVISTNSQRVDALTLERKAAHTLVRIEQGVVGWIASNQTKPIPKSVAGEEDGIEGGVEGGVVGMIAGGVNPTLPTGTPVYDRIDGRVIGEVTWGFKLVPAKQDKTWWRFDVKTQFGKIEVWTRAASAPSHSPPSAKWGQPD
ncbi:MAG: hypothetical protein H6Q90_5601 [Deltaproteobacteria bacterium]|nr:hypothetical protein [Deltaproteobacteria bacterium]